VKIFENAMDKLVQALYKSLNHTNSLYFLPLFRALFQGLISIERIAAGEILPRVLLFISACKQTTPDPFPLELQFFSELCSDMHRRFVMGEECPPAVRLKLQEAFKKYGFAP
jgi:hypothetical protein